MADRRVLLIAGDVVVAHPGEEIVRVVVLAHVAEAEPPIFVRERAALGARWGRGRIAVRPFACRTAGAQAAVQVGLTLIRSNSGESFS